MAAPTKLYNLLQNRRGEQCSPQRVEKVELQISTRW